MTLKLWDVNKESAPVMTYNVHEHLRARVRPALSHVIYHNQQHTDDLHFRSCATCTKMTPSLTSSTAA